MYTFMSGVAPILLIVVTGVLFLRFEEWATARMEKITDEEDVGEMERESAIPLAEVVAQAERKAIAEHARCCVRGQPLMIRDPATFLGDPAHDPRDYYRSEGRVMVVPAREDPFIPASYPPRALTVTRTPRSIPLLPGYTEVTALGDPVRHFIPGPDAEE